LSQGSGLLVLDEAYIEFAEEVDPAYLNFEAPNVVRTRTFSKAFALAGLRVGYAVGSPEVIDQLSRIADSYNVNRVSQAAAVAALEAEGYYAARLDEMRVSRGWLSAELRGRHFDVKPSQGNFVFALHPRARELYEGLKRRGILVRHFSRPPLDGGLRISIGTMEELQQLMRALDELL
jgi:histidinol-phosphate aminotransferase